MFRALTRELEHEAARYPDIICLPANILELEDDIVDSTVPWIITGAANGAMQNGQKETVKITKLVPVLLCMARIDRLERDLYA